MSMAAPQREDFDRLLFALRDDELTGPQAAELEKLVSEHPEAMQRYLRFVNLNAGLYWMAQDASELDDDQLPICDLSIRQPSNLPSISLSPINSPLSPTFVGGPVFSYMVASVVLCMMLLGSWAYKITHVDPSRPGVVEQENRNSPQFVGRITGMKDCVWPEDALVTMPGASVPMGRKYTLESGLMEIAYTSGAKVILEGPCEYTADSRAGGFLRVGKLVARVEDREERREERGEKTDGLVALATSAKPQAAVSNPELRTPNPESPAPCPQPLFSVRTPSAIVTDLGTEFGVKVDDKGNTISHVFQGSISVEAIPSDGGLAGDANQAKVILRRDESAQVVKDAVGCRRVLEKSTGLTPVFVQTIPDTSVLFERTHAIDGRVLQDDFDGVVLNTEKWSTHIRHNGDIHIADDVVTICTDASSLTGIACLHSAELDFGDNQDNWWAEIRFKMDGALKSGGFQITRDWIVLAGVSRPVGKWETQGIDIRAMQRGGEESDSFDLGWWGWDNKNDARIPVALARGLDKGRFYNLKIHRKPDKTVEIYLDGRLIGAKPLILGQNPTVLRCGDASIHTGGTQAVDYLKVGGVAENKSTSKGEIRKEEQSMP